MLLGLGSPDGTISPLELRAIGENELRNFLLSIPGVSQVSVLGGALAEYQVRPNPTQMAIHGITLSDIIDAAGSAHTTRGAGYLPNVDGRELPIRQMAKVRSLEDIKQTVVRLEDGAAITLGDVADVVLSSAPRRGTATVKGQPAIILSVQKALGTNTLALTKAIDAALPSFESSLPAGAVLFPDVFRQQRFIEASVSNVSRVLVEALILVAAIVILFLLNWRAAFMTLCALPVSLAIAIVVLDLWGLGINVMTLGGLAIAIGELVDDAIIDVENVLRRLHQNQELPTEQRRNFLLVVYDASNEIRSSVVFATIIICLVFTPLLFLQGIEGRFFRPMALAYMVSIMASLLVALTLTPALCSLLLRRLGKDSSHSQPEKANPVVVWLRRRYDTLLDACIRGTRLLLAGAGTATILAIAVAGTFGTNFLPEFNEGTYTVFLMMPPGTSLDESDRLATSVEKRLLEIPGVRTVSRRTGRAERDEHAEPVSSSEVEVSLQPEAERTTVRQSIDQVLRGIPGVTASIGQPIEHRLSHILSGTPAALAISVYGEDLAVLRDLARKIERELRAIPGTRDVAANREIMIDTVPVDFNRRELLRRGLTPQQVTTQLEAGFQGMTVGQVMEGVRRTDIVVRLDPAARHSPEDLLNFHVYTEDGAQVPLRDVATVGLDRSSNLIIHDNGRRKALISCNVADGANLGDLVQAVREKVDPIVHQAGYTVSYGGQFEAQIAATKTILLGSGVVLAAIFFMLSMALRSTRAAALVLVNLPLGLIGGVVGVFFIHQTQGPLTNALALVGWGTYTAPILTIPALVGFITLFGIAIRNGILLVNHYSFLQEKEKVSLQEAVRRGSSERLVPILMTALSAILGLIPLALAQGQPGSEILAPLSLVVLFGLITSTALNSLVLPCAYLAAFSRHRPTSSPTELDFTGENPHSLTHHPDLRTIP
jgi:HME family heavy-metal exporter